MISGLSMNFTTLSCSTAAVTLICALTEFGVSSDDGVSSDEECSRVSSILWRSPPLDGTATNSHSLSFLLPFPPGRPLRFGEVPLLGDPPAGDLALALACGDWGLGDEGCGLAGCSACLYGQFSR